ncbi:hypothetical protein BDY19DRAFT_429274 [Irpex rosettiformis]|uniref:Uncharacterized protein n=1 Tax=Irpex rosettiformis TaxID=378272 RepID=A0ACB8TUE1_9APHY|nr:hypothetical protein BDY19DRAFT_429274 [Irpex rosettiformis]
MNHRKRRAADELLPTTRPLKIPRSNHAYLQSSSEHAALPQTATLCARWFQVGEEVYTLVGDTAGAMFNTLVRGVVGALFPRPDSEQELPTVVPEQLVTPLSTSPSIQSISPPGKPATQPSEPPPPPSKRHQPLNDNAIASSSTQVARWPESGQRNVTNTGLNPELSAGQRVRAAIYEASRRQNGPPRQHKPRRRHIFEKRHKKEVQEDRIKTREEMITQLYDIRRGRGGA